MFRRFRNYPQIGGKRGGIPSGWVEVDWIKSTGQQYIDTGFKGMFLKSSNISATVDTVTPPDGSTQYAYGCCDSTWTNGFNMSAGNGNGNIQVNWFGANTGKVVAFGKRIEVFNSMSLKVIDGERIQTSNAPRENDNSMYLFCDNRNGVALGGYFWRQEVYSFSLAKEDGTKILSLVGVRNDTTGEVAMCDTITGNIYHNAGTGAFVAGPDKREYTARDYVQDGLVAMWDGIENAGWGVHDAAATVWKDLVGSLHLTLSRGASFFDTALTADGTQSDGWMAKAEGSITTARTIEVVYKANAIDSGNTGNLIFHANCGSVYDHFVVLSNTSWINFSGYGKGNGTIKRASTGVVSSCSGVYASGANSSVVSAYFNGVKDANLSFNSNMGAGASGVLVGGQSATARKFNGEIYSVRTYNRALTDAEIAANYAVDKARFGLEG